MTENTKKLLRTVAPLIRDLFKSVPYLRMEIEAHIAREEKRDKARLKRKEKRSLK